MATRKGLSNASSFEGATHLVGELAPDGTASLQRENPNSNGTAGRPGLDSQDSGVSSEGVSIHGEFDGLVPESATESETAALPSTHFHNSKDPYDGVELKEPKSRRRKSLTVRLEKTDQAGRYQLTAEDPELRNLLKQGFERSKDGGIKKKRSRFRDLVFTRQFTTFDRQNSESASSPFHGFFSLFWSVCRIYKLPCTANTLDRMGVALLLIRISANNWRMYGSIFGGNEIVRLMLSHDVIVLGLTDGVMCASTVFCLFLQKIIARGYLRWNRAGWMLQNVCPGLFLLFLLLTILSDMAAPFPGRLSRISTVPQLAMDAFGFHNAALYYYAHEATQLCFLQWPL
jgi:sterol O-acyltransferase